MNQRRQRTRPIKVVFVDYQHAPTEQRAHLFFFQTLASKRAGKEMKVPDNAFVIDIDDPNWAARIKERLSKKEAIRTDRLVRRIQKLQFSSKSEEE